MIMANARRRSRKVLDALRLPAHALSRLHSRMRRIKAPENAGFFETLRVVPFWLVVFLDVLDLTLDVFAAPIVWAVLSRYHLQGLRNVATIEAIIPFTQPVPLLTVSWLLARWLPLGQSPESQIRDE